MVVVWFPFGSCWSVSGDHCIIQWAELVLVRSSAWSSAIPAVQYGANWLPLAAQKNPSADSITTAEFPLLSKLKGQLVRILQFKLYILSLDFMWLKLCIFNWKTEKQGSNRPQMHLGVSVNYLFPSCSFGFHFWCVLFQTLLFSLHPPGNCYPVFEVSLEAVAYLPLL